jgi:hypothetical protein
MPPRKRAQVPSIDVLLGGYQIGQPSGASSLPTLDEYLFNPSSKVKKAEVASKYQVITTYNLRATTSSNPKRPRTLKAGYDANTQTLTVVFWDGTWWNYYDVPPYLWEGFVLAESPGKYLEASGLNKWPKMGLADPAGMPREQRVRMNEIKTFDSYMYGDGGGFAAN